MAKCDICGKKVGMFDTIELSLDNRLGIPPIPVCTSCNLQMKLLKNGDYDAYKFVHSYVKTTEHHAYRFVKIWEKVPEEIKAEKEKEAGEAQSKILERDEQIKSIMTTTGYNFETHKILEYIGVSSGEVVLGTGFLSEFSAGISDFFGSASGSFAEKLEKAKNAALYILLNNAADKDANAIIGIDFDYITFASNMIGVVATGTLVKVQKIEE